MGLFNKFKKTPADDSEVTRGTESKVEEKAEGENKAPKEGVKSKEEKKAGKEEASKQKDRKKKSLLAAKILIKPLVTEKITALGAQGKYGFEVCRPANKIEIAKAVENAYGVRPIKVSVSNVSGKKVRYGRTSGKTKSWKKAVVTLKKGEKLEIFEGV